MSPRSKERTSGIRRSPCAARPADLSGNKRRGGRGPGSRRPLARARRSRRRAPDAVTDRRRPASPPPARRACATRRFAADSGTPVAACIVRRLFHTTTSPGSHTARGRTRPRAPSGEGAYELRSLAEFIAGLVDDKRDGVRRQVRRLRRPRDGRAPARRRPRRPRRTASPPSLPRISA